MTPGAARPPAPALRYDAVRSRCRGGHELTDAIPFLLLDLALAVLAARRPWVGLAVLLAGLPASGLIAHVIPTLLGLSPAAELALAGWRDAVLGGIVLAAAMAWWRSGERRLRPAEWLVLAVVAVGAVYVVVSPVPLTAAYVYRVLYEPPVLLAAILILSRTSGMPAWVPTRTAAAFVTTVTIAALYTWPQVYLLHYRYLQTFYTEPGRQIHHSFLARGIDQPRGIGTLTSPNEFGAVLAIAIVLLLTPGLLKMQGWLRTTLLAVAGLALLLSFSRSGMLATLIAVIVMAWLSRAHLPGRHRVASWLRRPATWFRHGIPAAAALALVVAVFATSGAPRLVEATVRGSDPSAGNRPESARAGLAVFIDNPLGLGLGTAGPKATRFDEASGTPRILTETWYILYAIQVGIGGLLLLMVLALTVLRRLWQRRARPMARAAIGFGLGLGAGALFIPIIEDPAVFTPLWAFSALGMAAAAASSRGREPDSDPGATAPSETIASSY